MTLAISSPWRVQPHITRPFRLPIRCVHTSPSRTLAVHRKPQNRQDDGIESDETSKTPFYDRRLDRRAAELHRIPRPASKIETTDERKYARNLTFRQAYRDARTSSNDKNDPRLVAALKSPYVPAALQYPSRHATRRSANRANKAARMIMGQDTVWKQSLHQTRQHDKHFLSEPLPWHTILAQLKATTPQRSGGRQVSALRIRLPDSWHLPLPDNKMVKFIEPSTGLAAHLRTSPYYKGGSVLVLRGWRETLGKAADELIAVCKDVQIFELGEVASLDYESKQLWPKIQGTQDDGMSIETDMMDKVWAHQDHSEEPLEMRYEDIPRPEKWTSESLGEYITKLAHRPLQSDLARSLYSHLNDPRQNRPPTQIGTHFLDTDGVRVKLMFDALTDPAVKSLVNIGMFKMAIAFMASRGGHRHRANQLLEHAEEVGLPVDAEAYNLMLQCYVKLREARFFYRLLRRMRARFIEPNGQTWLLYMQLLQRAEHRNIVAVALWQSGMFAAPTVRRSVASIMARHDAYTAFRGRQTLKAFLESRTTRYGQDWFTAGAMRDILDEYLAFHESRPLEVKKTDLSLLLDRQLDDGDTVKTKDINVILDTCVETRDWELATWALSLLDKYGCKADKRTYELLVKLAMDANRPRALGLVLFYAIAERKYSFQTRLSATEVLTGTSLNTFWWDHQPHLFSAELLARLKPARRCYTLPLEQVAETIREICDGYVPAKTLSSLAHSELQLDSTKDSKSTPATIELHDPKDADAPRRTHTLQYAYEWFTGTQPVDIGEPPVDVIERVLVHASENVDVTGEAALAKADREVTALSRMEGEVLSTNTAAGFKFLTQSPETAPVGVLLESRPLKQPSQ